MKNIALILLLASCVTPPRAGTDGIKLMGSAQNANHCDLVDQNSFTIWEWDDKFARRKAMDYAIEVGANTIKMMKRTGVRASYEFYDCKESN